MSCAGSERVEDTKGFKCRNMGDVLGKECEKEDTSLTRSVEDVIREEAEGPVSLGAGSESDSDKDISLDSDEDLSWLLPINTIDLGAKKCKCEGCLKLFESYNSDKKNAKLLLSSWKEFRNYIRNVYINSPLETSQKNEVISFEENERLHEIIQVMRLCDPYQLFQKIEDEVCSMVLESRIRQLNLLKDENNPALAEEFITGLIEEYVKLLSSALQLSPAIENLLGPQLRRFGLTWEVLNKQLYRSLVYNHLDVQQNLLRFTEQLRKMLPLKDDLYHELVHQYLAFDGEMTLIGTMWKNVEPLIQEYRNLKSKENEKLNNLLDAMKDFFANKLCSSEEGAEETHDENQCSTSEDALQYCPSCMTRRGCPCDECTVTHMMSCEDILLGVESPLEETIPSRSRSRSPIKKNEVDFIESVIEKQGEEQQSCECHACTIPPPDLMDCSAAFSQSTGKSNVHGEGFQLYPHIHGKVLETDNVSNIYGNFESVAESVYPHLYNLHTPTNSVDDQSQVNSSIRAQIMQAIVANKINSHPYQPSSSPPPPPPPLSPPPPFASSQEPILSGNSSQFLPTPKDNSVKNTVNSVTSEQLEQVATTKKSVDKSNSNETVKGSSSEKGRVYSSKVDGKKNELVNKSVAFKESEAAEKVPEKSQARLQGNVNGNACVKSRLCGKCCLKHGSNCFKMPGCTKTTDKNLATIARLGLSANSNSRAAIRCIGNDHSHKITKSHSCGKLKPHENIKKGASKKGLLDVDDASSPEDSCSEGSNSTSTSAQKDPRHCDCCYCEVFGHGVPSVAPVSRNYQEMRERLRLRLNMKKSAKSKTGQPVPPGQTPQKAGQSVQKIAGVNTKPQVNKLLTSGDAKKDFKEQDIESLIKYIEGNTKGKCKDAKKAAKRARQKQKKQEEKEKLEEKEAERKRLETMKRQVSINLVNDNKRSQNTKQANPVPKTPPKRAQPQTLNLSGLKSLVEKSDPSAVPKMVTIRRIMAPFSAEPTVTITLKGSTPDKDKVLFMLKNGTEAPRPEDENTKKSKKKKKNKKEDFQEEVFEPVYETQVENVPSKKKKKKNKNLQNSDNTESVSRQIQVSKLAATEKIDTSKTNKSKNSKENRNVSSSGNAKIATSAGGNNKISQNSSTFKPPSQINSNSSVLQNSKSNSQKSVLKVKSQNNKQDTVCKTNKNSSSNVGKKSVQNNINQVNKISGNSSKGINSCKSVSASNKIQKEVVTNTKNTNNNSDISRKGKNEKKQNSSGNSINEKQIKGQKNVSVDLSSRVPQNKQNKNKTVGSNRENSKKKTNTLVEIPQKLLTNQRTNSMEISKLQDKKQETNKKGKSNKKAPLEDVEVNWKGQVDRNDKGKVIINTPSYRLSEVLSSIAPSPPPKEEINLENLRLPPGITITKIEGPITKPVRPVVQPNITPKPAPPIIMSTPALKPNPPPGNVIVVDTGRLKEVIKENSQMSAPTANTTTSNKKKKKKNKQQAENVAPTIEVPKNLSKLGARVSKNSPPVNRGGMSVLSNMDTRRMVSNLENQQATIIKTSGNMVTIRSPALQQAMNIHAYQNSHSYKPGINGYNINSFSEEVNRINNKIGNLKLSADSDDRLTRQMRNLNIKDGSRANELFAQAMAAASNQNSQENVKKKKKKKKQGKSGEEREVEPVESVFQPKDIDLENGDIDDDERELEAFKRFCFQSVPPERKDKVKVNLNIKDIVLKKKSSAIGCS